MRCCFNLTDRLSSNVLSAIQSFLSPQDSGKIIRCSKLIGAVLKAANLSLDFSCTSFSLQILTAIKRTGYFSIGGACISSCDFEGMVQFNIDDVFDQINAGRHLVSLRIEGMQFMDVSLLRDCTALKDVHFVECSQIRNLQALGYCTHLNSLF